VPCSRPGKSLGPTTITISRLLIIRRLGDPALKMTVTIDSTTG
jgi:hypothetical protein